MNDLILSPEQERLKRQIAELKRTIADQIALKDEMTNQTGPKLEALYLSRIGCLQYELFVLQTEISKLKLQISLMQSYMNQNSPIDFEKVEQEVSEAVQAYQKIIEEKAEQIRAAKELLEAPLMSREETAELKKLYHLIVKHLHPDLNPGVSDQEKELFFRAQIAYKMCDLNEMRLVFMAINRQEKMPDSENELAVILKNLQKMTEKLQRDIDVMSKNFPFDQQELLADEILIAHRQEKLRKEIEQKKVELTEYQQYANALKLWKPGLLN